ncbi:hypothetical protein RclHR1_00500015 [Rhizophagus clarus]|uniref:Kinase-like domain-containing protein n=1 Tax=Rhizophagus clarus TaxID=94130 RepID=A0A2Z6SDE4_9GLOM|nr:hypothetical protein RclHR1_00500015 [Rhizophagus clarus]GES97481.1 kinase-like domain-containing protein [Rhizophagus clarus]
MNENSVDDNRESKNDNNGEIIELKATETETKILSLIEEITKKYDEMVEICQTAEYNKQVHELLSKIEKTDIALNNLRIHKKMNSKYFSEENHTNLCKLVTVINKIYEFVTEISQLKDYKVEIYKDLNNEFDIIVQLLELNLKVPFSNFLRRIEEVNFLPLVREVTKIYNEIIEVYQTSKYNKNTCLLMMRRVEIADISLRNLRDNREENSDYFSKSNYINLCSLVKVIDKIRKFVAKISYYEVKNIDENFKYLNDEFDSIVQLLKFSLIISSTAIVCTGIETASKVEVLFAKFLPFIKKVNKFHNEIVKICMAAQNNKKKCEIMLGRVRIVEKALKTLKIRNLGFFSEKNYKNFNILVNIIDEINQYLAKISQLKDDYNYEDIENKFFKLDDEFKTTLQLLQPFLIINFAASNDKRIQTDVDEEWIKMKIMEYDIDYFEYSEFSDIEKAGKGEYGIVNKAVTNYGVQVALKVINEKTSMVDEDDIKKLINELKLVRMAQSHLNVIRFLGVAMDDVNFIMVLEYANNGNLREYLKKNFDSFQWKDKIQMAFDMTCGLRWLHSKGIIHRGLHSKNVFVNNGRLLIGLSRLSTDAPSNTTVANRTGMTEYFEPQVYKNIYYIRDKKSDVYSLGVLLWEITSGRPPFCTTQDPDRLSFYICCNNLREKPIEGTPLEYQQLYQKCWDDEPKIRPDIDQVYDEISNQLDQLNDKNNSSDNDTSEHSNEIDGLYLPDD